MAFHEAGVGHSGGDAGGWIPNSAAVRQNKGSACEALAGVYADHLPEMLVNSSIDRDVGRGDL